MKDIPDLLCLPFTHLNWIEPGTFLFQGKKEITFKKGFYAGCYQVTQELYEKIMGVNPSHFKGKHRSVEQVSWEDAKTFLQELNERIKLDNGFQFKLPSETQWEYAALANQKIESSSNPKFPNVGWFEKVKSNIQLRPVGLQKPNDFGLYDMSGNVWEWCDDTWCYEIEKIPANGTAFKGEVTDTHVIRGGDRYMIDLNTRLLARSRYLLFYRNRRYNGMRVFRY